MPSVAGRRTAGARDVCVRRLTAASALALALAAAGCTGGGQPIGSLAGGRGATIAFESIDGPPHPVFQRLVENLAAEAVARQVIVISREAAPSYRIRGYMAAHVEGRRTHIGWVWDVYDADKHRVLRIADEEPGGRAGADAWNAADEAMLRRIARTGMDRLAAFLDAGGARSLPNEPPVGTNGPAVAAIGGGQAQPADAGAGTPNAPAPASPKRPQRTAHATALEAAMALADTRP